MPIEGDLNTVSLFGILQLLCEEKKTGVLRLSKERGEEYQIIFVEGEIVYAAKPFKKDLLGDFLKQDGLVSQEQIEEALKMARKNRYALGKSLVQLGFITREDLSRVLSIQIEEILFRLLLWKEGGFYYGDSQPNLNWLLQVPLNTMKMLMNAAGKVDEALHMAQAGN